MDTGLKRVFSGYQRVNMGRYRDYTLLLHGLRLILVIYLEFRPHESRETFQKLPHFNLFCFVLEFVVKKTISISEFSHPRGETVRNEHVSFILNHNPISSQLQLQKGKTKRKWGERNKPPEKVLEVRVPGLN